MNESFEPVFGVGEPNEAFGQYFIGNSYLNPLAASDAAVSNVTFEPGCRNNWHIHHGAHQILLCTDGEGWYQEWGKPAQKLVAGSVVDIAPEVKHWHGASAESWFAHVAISVPLDGASNEWLEPVDDDQYDAL